MLADWVDWLLWRKSTSKDKLHAQKVKTEAITSVFLCLGLIFIHSSKLRNIQAVFSWTLMRWVIRSALASSLASPSIG